MEHFTSSAIKIFSTAISSIDLNFIGACFSYLMSFSKVQNISSCVWRYVRVGKVIKSSNICYILIN